ncbi:peptidase dimerization domain-containing protein [Ramlibacter sp. AW1]|uniref:Peptidase dimerization domain-containing protein n=1 Tax=Ramlibacter aurantiacus TaxID=2801330 RepID=A0A936ZQL5_9BURK|nr:peptidase dimerization domain-containing protein [Ramlibacter aurantiacus]MBL0420716.1 peptidase dimerization domain-containing protein [Ramlibacter aurantiacus]
MTASESPEKKFLQDFIERNRDAIAGVGDSVFHFGELGMQEHRTCELLCSLLEEHGFASVSADFTFHGESAHAAMWPWRGRDALDAVVLMDMGIAQWREHMRTTITAHRVITHGGDQPNVIPARASVWWYFRDSTAEGARGLFEQAKKIAQGAALMTNTTVEVGVRSAVWPVLGNAVMAEVVQRNIEAIGMPGWTAREQDFARSLQRQAKVAEDGLRAAVAPLLGPSKQIPASNDAGDVSWKVPMTRVWFPSNVPNIPFHHWTGGAALATSIALPVAAARRPAGPGRAQCQDHGDLPPADGAALPEAAAALHRLIRPASLFTRID